MIQPSPLELARSGDPAAIAILMNATLQSIGVTARVIQQRDGLYVLLESERRLAEHAAVEFVRQGLTRLGIGWLSSVVVCSRSLGDSMPVWVQKIDFHPVNVNPFMAASQLNAGMNNEHDRLQASAIQASVIQAPAWQQSKLFHLLLLTIPLLILLNAGYIWRRYLTSPPLPKASSTEPQRQKLSQPRPTTQASLTRDPFAAAIEQANQAFLRCKTAQTRADWHEAAIGWRQAIAWLKRVPANHPSAATARQKLVAYQQALNDVLKGPLSKPNGMVLKKTIVGGISPKSVVYSGRDRFFAQNMMYRHSITVYDRDYNLVKTISDRVKLSDYDYPQFQGTQQGAPVEAAFTQEGKTAWVSNYQMYGAGFKGTADDTCSPSGNHDPSFVYRIDTHALTIDRAVQVGAVPKFVAATPNNRLVLVSNWCSWDVSVIDPQQNKEIRRLQVGPYPRGIAIDAASQVAYVAVMGSHDIATIDLKNFSLDWLRGVGRSPRHLNLDPNGTYLYATLNGEGTVAKIDLTQRKVISKVATGKAPRSMTLSSDGAFLYVVNYNTDTVSKVRTMDMAIVQSVKVNPAPIGITYDPKTHQVWVACYSGSILVFQD